MKIETTENNAFDCLFKADALQICALKKLY